MPLTCFAFFILAVSMINFFSNRASRKDKDRSAGFWNRESKANSTPKKDLSTLPYISLDDNLLSFSIEESPRLLAAREQVFALKDRKILDLKGMSNTDLKLTYGAANLPALTQYEENFFCLCERLQEWGEALSEEGYHKEAIQVLQYALLIGSDLSSTRTLLNDLCRNAQACDETQISFK
ncbi:MAG: hypothetical protein ACI39H_10315 [Lachnospiraceae bacterium]